MAPATSLALDCYNFTAFSSTFLLRFYPFNALPRLNSTSSLSLIFLLALTEHCVDVYVCAPNGGQVGGFATSSQQLYLAVNTKSKNNQDIDCNHCVPDNAM